MIPSLTLALTPLLAPVSTPAGGLEWFQGSLDEAVAKAAEADSHVMVYFWRNGSDHCGKFYQNALQNGRTPRVVGDMVCYSANYDEEVGGELFARFNVSRLPTVLFISPDGVPDDAILGYTDPEGFLSEVERVHRGEGTRRGLLREAETAEVGTEETIELLWKLAGKCSDLGDQENHDAVLASLRETHDPDARTVIGARAHLWKVQKDVYACLEDCACEDDECGEDCSYEASLVQLDPQPLYEHAERVRQDEARFEGWNAVANAEAARRSADTAVKAYRKALEYVPDEQGIGWTKQVAWWAIESGEEATQRQRKLALDMAELCVKKAKNLDPMSEEYAKAYGDAEPRTIQAEALGALAFAYDLHGDARRAKKTAEDALELAGSDELREFFAEILEG